MALPSLLKDTLPLWPKILNLSKCSDFFSRYTSWYADSYEIKFEMPFHATFRARSLAKSSLFGPRYFLKFSVIIGRIHPSDDQNLYINRKHVIFVSCILQSILFQKLTILWDFSKHFGILEAKNVHDMMKFCSPPLHIFTFRRKTLYILSTYGNPSKFSGFFA